MTGDRLLGVGTLIVGLTMSGLGLWAYVGRSAETYFRKWWNAAPGLFGPATTMFLLPAGAGLAFIGIAFIVGKNAFTSELLVLGLLALLLGWIVFFVHPSRIQPRWMRSRKL